MTMVLIESQELASAAASITFTDIPQTYTDLYLVLSLRGSDSAVRTSYIEINGSSSNFSARSLRGDGSATSSFTATNRIGEINGTSQTASTFTNDSVYLPNYSGSAYKSYSVDHTRENNATAASLEITAGLWSVTDAITSITINRNVGNFVQYSSATLYGVLAGSDGVTSVS